MSQSVLTLLCHVPTGYNPPRALTIQQKSRPESSDRLSYFKFGERSFTSKQQTSDDPTNKGTEGVI